MAPGITFRCFDFFKQRGLSVIRTPLFRPLFVVCCWFSQGVLDAEVATVDEVEHAVALSQATLATLEDGSDSAARVPASPRCQRSLHTLSSSSSSDFIVLGNDSDSDFVVHEEATS
jgi:hypothetical protein